MKHVIFLSLLLVASGQSLASSHLYVVKESDTLAEILRAHNYGQTYSELVPFIDEIVQANPGIFVKGNANFIIPGSTFALPKNPNQAEAEPEPEPVAEPAPEPIPESEPVPELPIIGNVQASSGRTEIRRDNETIAIKGTESLYARDIIFTHQGSLAEITLRDNTRFLMGPESEFSISEFSFTEPPAQGENALGSLLASFSSGVIRTITGLIGKFSENQFQIDSTLTASIGIRGTDFTVRSCNQIEACGDLYGVAVAVQGGSISLENAAAEIELKQNEFAQVQSTSAAPARAPLPEGFFDLQRDVTEIEVNGSWWQKVIELIKFYF